MRGKIIGNNVVFLLYFELCLFSVLEGLKAYRMKNEFFLVFCFVLFFIVVLFLEVVVVTGFL